MAFYFMALVYMVDLLVKLVTISVKLLEILRYGTGRIYKLAKAGFMSAYDYYHVIVFILSFEY